MATLLKDVVDYYTTNYQANLDDLLKWYPTFFKGKYDDEVKAEILLIGNHQSRQNDITNWHADVKSTLDKLVVLKLWDRTYSSFEEILSTIETELGKARFIGVLAKYDMALRLASMNPSVCMPTKVYLHNGTLAGANQLMGKGCVKKIGREVEPSVFGPELAALPAHHIENLLCIMHSLGVFVSKALPTASGTGCGSRGTSSCGLSREWTCLGGVAGKLRGNLLVHHAYDLGVTDNAELKLHSNFFK